MKCYYQQRNLYDARPTHKIDGYEYKNCHTHTRATNKSCHQFKLNEHFNRDEARRLSGNLFSNKIKNVKGIKQMCH